MKIEQTDEYIKVREYTDSEAYCWESIWDHKLTLLSLYLDGQDTKDILSNKNHVHYHRVSRAKPRHLRGIKEHLGLEVMKENRERELFILNKSVYNWLSPIVTEEGIVHAKTVDIHSLRHKKSEVFYGENTPERTKLVQEYNERLAEFLQFQERAIAEIFGKEQMEDWK